MGFTPERLQALEDTLSSTRLAHWQDLVPNQSLQQWRARAQIRIPAGREAAVLLHQWNTALSMAFMASLQIFELALRNKIHAAMTHHAGRPDWWHPAAQHLEPDNARQLEKAIDKLAQVKKKPTTDRIVAELTLGFWVSLTGPGYDNSRVPNLLYWRNCLSRLFTPSLQKPLDRAAVNADLNRIRRLRNNVAHHEPIVTKDLKGEYANILRFARLLCPETAAWMDETSLVPGLLNADWLSVLACSGKMIGRNP
ncbi:hypothetical protein FHR90_002399 [Endobacter medicaginis]|uniref:Abi-like protein n=1 Tax=Endobacter medicaginis TaxID=1181271 RepID=A0A850NPR8_9PROT|nr:hypothetical protein [Endobacter medicaginis]MBB3174554.1 hypothetical protein [Endobacter medicaginis]MCX5474753.1 hypothetical protein [Endobacter medicaginis]NVN29175.1 hypothetical protein [Endobacter medicaginis]